MSDAYTAAKNTVEKKRLTIEYDGTEFEVVKRPSSLLLAEMARTESAGPEALGTIAEFLEHTLGKVGYGAFKRQFHAQEFDTLEDEMGAIQDIISQVCEVTLGRPTE